MATVIVGDHLEVRVCCSFAEQAAFNVHHFEVTAFSSGASASTLDIAKAIAGAFENVYKPALTSAARYEGVGVKLDALEAVEEGWLGNDGPGTSGDPLPRSTSGIITYTTAVAGRRGKGRKYIPFPSIDHQNVTTAKPTAAYQVLLAAIAFIYVGNNAYFFPGTPESVTLKSVLKHVAGGYETITGSIARPKWGQQRSRGDYGRPNAVPDWAG